MSDRNNNGPVIQFPKNVPIVGLLKSNQWYRLDELGEFAVCEVEEL